MQKPAYAGTSIAATTRPMAVPGQARARNRPTRNTGGRTRLRNRVITVLESDTKELATMKSLQPRGLSQAAFTTMKRCTEVVHGRKG